jgi:hypothetical protein
LTAVPIVDLITTIQRTSKEEFEEALQLFEQKIPLKPEREA